MFRTYISTFDVMIYPNDYGVGNRHFYTKYIIRRYNNKFISIISNPLKLLNLMKIYRISFVDLYKFVYNDLTMRHVSLKLEKYGM